MNCPNCGQQAQEASIRCGYCNYKLPEMAMPDSIAGTVTLYPCWNCKHPNAADAQRCETCNAKQTAVLRVALNHPVANRAETLRRAAI